MDRGLLTPQARVLLCVADDCDVRMRDIADQVGISERAAYDMLCELIEQGYLTRERNGRRNCYRLHPRAARRAAEERDRLTALASLLEQ